MLKKYEIESLQKYFDAANYISACQLYLLDNPLLQRKLEMSILKRSWLVTGELYPLKILFILI